MALHLQANLDRQAVRADALRVPIVRDAAQLTRGHDDRVIRLREEVVAVGDSDVRAAVVEDGVAHMHHVQQVVTGLRHFKRQAHGLALAQAD